jgi:hypothetical protein
MGGLRECEFCRYPLSECICDEAGEDEAVPEPDEAA